ncbi:hypothetical protein [Dyadobacter sp. MSC1_007]|uniref:hypothetical protein n=1 Tax=Dyadobacter sp. MSC1_007 TaxID=2909264 RepID=UPI00202FD7F1|nr:hypothetical protein [Dyadobacter sp. MSC1_007]
MKSSRSFSGQLTIEPLTTHFLAAGQVLSHNPSILPKFFVGTKADSGNPVDSPVNVHKMVENLSEDANGDYRLQVTVKGRGGRGYGKRR